MTQIQKSVSNVICVICEICGSKLPTKLRVFTPSRGITLLLLLFIAGCGAPSLLITPVKNTSALQEISVKPGSGWAGDKIAIIEVEGILANARAGGLLDGGENALSLFTQELERAENDRAVKAVVLRVNSPGGTVTASDTMYGQLIKFKARTHKPVVASAQEIMASGAYYVACGSDKIIVQPTSLVGSIGVIFTTFDVEGGMKMLGIRSNVMKSGEMKDMASPFHALGDKERAVMQGLVDEYFARFKAVVASARKVDDTAKMALATDGRVFSGTQAVALGLADQTGTLEDAIDVARAMSGAGRAKVVMYKRPFGYSGSIYADSNVPEPSARADAGLLKNIPGASQLMLPGGFYYLWKP